MSDYKEVECSIVINDKVLLMQALQAIVGACATSAEADLTIAENTEVKNMFNHTHRVSLAIKKEQLPTHLQEYGDLGIVEKNGKFSFLAIQPNESHYVDRRKGWAEGTFAKASEDFISEIEQAYGCLLGAQEMVANTPGLRISGPLQSIQEADGSSAWGIAFECPEEVVKRVTQSR